MMWLADSMFSKMVLQFRHIIYLYTPDILFMLHCLGYLMVLFNIQLHVTNYNISVISLQQIKSSGGI